MDMIMMKTTKKGKLQLLLMVMIVAIMISLMTKMMMVKTTKKGKSRSHGGN